MTSNSSHDWAALIPEAPFDWEMIPLDGRKRPIDPATGKLMRAWASRPGYDIDGLSQLNGLVKAVGLKLGPPSGGVLAVDFDGPEAAGKFTEIYGRSPLDLPNTIGVTSGREKRGQRFFLVDQDWWPALCGKKTWNGTNGKTCLELRWAGHQSVIAGAHPQTNGYSWLPNSSPADIEMALAPDWLLEPLVHQEQQLEPVELTTQDSQRAINMLRFIDPQQHTDYDSWLAVGMALHNTDPGLLTAWVDWARPMHNFDEAEHLTKWQSFGKSTRTSGLTIRSLHHWAKAGGYKEPKRKTKTTSAPGTNNADDPKGFVLIANDTLQRLKDGIAAINDLPTPAARTAAQYTLRGELGLDKDSYKQLVQDLLEEQETPAPTSFTELMKLDTGVHASIEDLAAQGTLTLVAAEGHAGKTSLFYRMAEAISKGNNFAERLKTTQGAALIYQLDESPTDAITKFRRMSLEPDEANFQMRWKLSPSMIPELEQDIRDHKPVAVFADSLMRIFGGRGISLNDAEFGIWLYQLNTIASRYGTSFFLSHHLKKPENQKRTRVSKHDLFGTAFLFNGTSDCWGLYPSQQEGAFPGEFCLEFLKARSGVQDLGTVFNFQGCQEDYSWNFMGIQGQTESLEEKKLFADEVRDLLALKGGEWSAQQVADYFTLQGRPISNERARTTLVKLYERRLMVGRAKRASNGGRPFWKYFSTAPRA